MLAACLVATPAQSAGLLTVESALALAAGTHPSVAARRSDRDASERALEAAGWQRFPSVSVQTGRDANDRYVTTTSIEQPLWAGGGITSGIDAAQARLEGASAGIGEAEQAIMLRVATAFAEYGRMRARLVEAGNNVGEHQRLAEMMARRVQSQVSPESDAVLASARLTQARAEFAQFEAATRRAQTQLEQAIGLSVGDIAVPAAREPAVFTLTQALDAALYHSPLLRRLAAQESAANAEIGVQRGNALPRLSVRYDRSFGALVNDQRVYVALGYQSGAGLASVAVVREVAARREGARADREAGQREVIETVTNDWAEFESLTVQAGSLREQVRATTEVFDSFVRQFAVGRKSWIDVLNAQREASAARYALADAEWGGLGAVVRLQILTGEITPQTLPPLHLHEGASHVQ